MKLDDDTGKVTDSSSHTFDVRVEYDSVPNAQDFNGNTIVATHDKTVANLVSERVFRRLVLFLIVNARKQYASLNIILIRLSFTIMSLFIFACDINRQQ